MAWEMKAKIYFGKGQWWCRRMGVIGCGNTPQEAWNDMWMLYSEAVRPKIYMATKVRA